MMTALEAGAVDAQCPTCGFPFYSQDPVVLIEGTAYCPRRACVAKVDAEVSARAFAAFREAAPAPEELSFEAYQRACLVRALEQTGGDKLAAARLLKVGKSTLYRKCKQFGV